MARQNNFSLQTIQPEFTPFQAVTFTPQAVDTNILANSLNKIETRENTYNEKVSALDAAFSQMKETLPNDEETLNWFDRYTQGYKDRIKAFADNYDYGTAINMAVRAGGEAVSSAEYTGRKRYYEERKEWVDALKKRQDLTSRDKDYWERHYPQAYEDKRDASGKIIGGNHFEAPMPYKSIDWESAIESADKNVAEDVQGRESSTSYSDDYGGRSSGSSRVTRKKPLNKLVQGLREYMRKNPQVLKEFDLAYAELMDDWKDLNDTRNKYAVGTPEYDAAQTDIDIFLETIGSKNGGFPDKQTWLAWNVEHSEYAKLHSYENVQSGSQSATSKETKGRALISAQGEEERKTYRETHAQPGDTSVEQGKERKKDNLVEVRKNPTWEGYPQ